MDDYVECADCGHPLERHGLTGCDLATEGCACRTRWTVRQIEQVRADSGLPRRWDRTAV